MNRKFEPSELVVLRTPLLPFEEIEAWTAGLLSPECQEDGLAEALAHDRALLRERLQKLIGRPEVREALFLASPDLFESLDQWRREPESKKGQRTEQGLVRYFLRMATRPTPFGLFSGCTAGVTGAVGERTRLRLSPRGEYRRHSRLDMDYLFALCEHLRKDPGLRSELLYRPNSSLYETAGRFRYAEARVAGRLRTYHLVAIDVFDALKETIERAADGARLQDLAEALVAGDPDGDITMEDAEGFLQELVDSQVLVADLDLPVTGEESTPGLLRQLDGLGGSGVAAEARERLARAERDLAGLDGQGIGGAGNDSEAYRAIARDLEPLGVPVELSHLVQVDMTKPAREVRLGREVMDEILRGIGILHRIVPTASEGGSLDDFRKAFKERYGEGREVPFAAVLDEESGIGFGGSGRSRGAGAEASPLLEGLPFQTADETTPVSWSSQDRALLRLLNRALFEGRMEVELTAGDLAQLERPKPVPLPDAFHAMATLVAGSPEELERGDYRLVVEHAAGPSGARLHGRFCHADAAIHAGVRAHLAAEEAHVPEAVFAEIVHLPAGRVGNILARPVLRSHEIVFLGRSGALRERQIRVDDLTVTVEGNRVRLRSRSIGGEVIPRLSTAHNTGRGGLGVYRFLAAVQGQQQANALMWSWGQLDSSPFLPRVTHGRLVLSRARWRCGQSELKAMVAARGDHATRYRLARAWREERRLPRLVSLVDGDNELMLDFDNPLSLDAVLELVRNRPEITLMELIPGPEELCVRGPEGRFFHELLVSFTRTPAERSVLAGRDERSLPPPAAPVARTFPPGSEWLFAKIYTGTAAGDQALRDEIVPLAREVLAAGDARSWFFIRYSDPDWHLRVRFRGEPGRLLGAVLPRLEKSFQRLLAPGTAWKLQLDTYEREIERYGGPEGIELSEELFRHDSDAVAAIVESLSSDAGADLRWRLILLGMDRMMEDFGHGLEGRQRLAEAGRAGFAGRYRQDVLRGPVADRLRKERPALERLLAVSGWGGGGGDVPEELQPALDALARRSAAFAPVIRELRERERQGRLRPGVEEILPSYVHMFVNRLSRSAGPEHEMVLYDFLGKMYASLRARARGRAAG
jgi:thiopeptide-type bacteriocin biosynthesis protein